eukprot:scaffold7594_cov111-Isochrysis_galbana.AAC.7
MRGRFSTWVTAAGAWRLSGGCGPSVAQNPASGVALEHVRATAAAGRRWDRVISCVCGASRLLDNIVHRTIIAA